MNTLFDRDLINQLDFDENNSAHTRKGRSISLFRWMRFAEVWHQKHKNRYQHLTLEDHLLQDIGKTRMDVELDTDELLQKFESGRQKTS